MPIFNKNKRDAFTLCNADHELTKLSLSDLVLLSVIYLQMSSKGIGWTQDIMILISLVSSTWVLKLVY